MEKPRAQGCGPFWFLCLFIVSSSCGGGSKDKFDARALANALTDELTQEMQFDNGTLVEGPPPVEHAGDPAFPQVLTQPLDNANRIPGKPIQIFPGEKFEIQIQTDFPRQSEIVGAVIHVIQANQQDEATDHIEIIFPPTKFTPPPITDDGRVTLTGVVQDTTDIAGASFYLMVALMRKDPNTGETGVGNYLPFFKSVPVPAGVESLIPQCACNNPTGREGEVVIIGPCTSEWVKGELATSPCDAWGASLTELNPAMSGQVTRMLLPSGTRAYTWYTEALLDPPQPACTLELQCN